MLENRSLPPPSDLAQQITKDPYHFDFFNVLSVNSARLPAAPRLVRSEAAINK